MASKLFETNFKFANGDKYSRAISKIQYEPRREKPHIESLCDKKKYIKLINKIEKSNLPEEEKKFLRLAASRLIVFNYSLIADYYAHSDKEVQELMEEMALVIIDIDDGIANGFVELSKRLEELADESKKRKNKID